ncbi:MAG TPA: hypothetical protein VLM91_07615 [Candidatus Methylomirabilis sp.]|nr:hypothetical protein [Candidatus Methylomirabilis sp.]
MAQRWRGKTLESLEGKLAVIIRREVQKVLGVLKREIAKREGELATLKAEYKKGLDLLRRRQKTGPARRRRRGRQANWKQVFSTLPTHFTLETLQRHPVAGKRSKPHLYAIISRWKKEKLLTPDPAGGYRKIGAQLKKKQVPRAKPVHAPKPAARAEAPGA